MLNEGHHWQNLSGPPEPTMVGFRNLVSVGIGPISKQLAVNSCIIKSVNEIGKISYKDMECPRRTRPFFEMEGPQNTFVPFFFPKIHQPFLGKP